MPKPSAARWCAISAAMASAACSTTRRTSCITAAPTKAPEMRRGMIFTIEPMINLGRPHVKVLSDGWTAVTRDRSLSAQYEHTVGVTETGCEIFTLVAQRPRPARPATLNGLHRRWRNGPFRRLAMTNCLSTRTTTVARRTRRFSDSRQRLQLPPAEDRPPARKPHYLGHRDRLRERFRDTAIRRLPTTNCWSSCSSG